MDLQAAQDLPYLFGGTTTTTKQGQGTSAPLTLPNAAEIAATAAAAVSAAGMDMSQLSGSGDVETLKKYLMMREQDIAILSAQLGYAKEELGKAEQSIKSLNMQVEDFVHQLDDRNQRIETLEKELMHAGKSKESEIEQLRFELKSKIDRTKFLEDQLSTSAIQYEKLRDRVRQDIRKIRVREKELENKLEILKKDSETLIAARESKILELKRKIDLLEFNYDTLQDQNVADKANVSEAHEKIAKVVKVLKLAMGIIEGETDNGGKPLDENDLKVA
jgi:TolA-binding protein